MIEIGTNIAGRSAETAVFTNIEITSNKFVDMPSTLMRADNVNGFVFAENTVDTGEFFDSNSSQGRLEFGEYCSNVTYKNNDFVSSSFLRYKEIVKSDNVLVWAQINSQLS